MDPIGEIPDGPGQATYALELSFQSNEDGSVLHIRGTGRALEILGRHATRLAGMHRGAFIEANYADGARLLLERLMDP